MQSTHLFVPNCHGKTQNPYAVKKCIESAPHIHVWIPSNLQTTTPVILRCGLNALFWSGVPESFLASLETGECARAAFVRKKADAGLTNLCLSLGRRIRDVNAAWIYNYVVHSSDALQSFHWIRHVLFSSGMEWPVCVWWNGTAGCSKRSTKTIEFRKVHFPLTNQCRRSHLISKLPLSDTKARCVCQEDGSCLCWDLSDNMWCFIYLSLSQWVCHPFYCFLFPSRTLKQTRSLSTSSSFDVGWCQFGRL